jgi:Mg-chelatase subunit ChlD
VNVPAAAIAENEQALLRDYVRDRGGGLVVVGGDQALTPGGYHGTTLETILPVESVASRRGERPGLAMVLVVDRSLSMEEGDAIELAKEAMRRTIQLLAPEDQLGVLAFDEGSRWVSPIGPLGDKSRILARIDTLTAGGRTDMGPAMEKAYLALHEAFAPRKHIILLTDGISHPADFQALAERIARSGITISTVGLGPEACGPLLEEIARIGRGRFYECDDPRAVPSVFAQEAASAGRLGIHERPFRPEIGRESGWPEAAAVAGAPPLLGYVETQARPGVHVALASPEGDPLLASWRCGKGMSVAFTSDAEDRWAAAWLRWSGFAPFWTQVFRRAIRPEEAVPEAIPAKPQAAALARPAEPRAVPLWHYFLAAAAVLFVVDVAVRRVG